MYVCIIYGGRKVILFLYDSFMDHTRVTTFLEREFNFVSCRSYHPRYPTLPYPILPSLFLLLTSYMTSMDFDML